MHEGAAGTFQRTGNANNNNKPLSGFPPIDLPLRVHQEVPEPTRSFVTHWSKDVWSQMSYSFVKMGGSGEAYDILAEDVQGKLFFAGEVTHLSAIVGSNLRTLHDLFLFEF